MLRWINTCGSDHCRKKCPNVTDIHCGPSDDVCCDGAGGQTCGENLTCVTACAATDGPLCIDPSGNPLGVCCNGHDPATHDDDDVCLFGSCVGRGSPCTTFVDCPNGQYCETTIHDPGDPTQGVCLPNTFPPGTPVCQGGTITNLFSPTTEWAWTCIQLVTSSHAVTCAGLTNPNPYCRRCVLLVERTACTEVADSWSGGDFGASMRECFGHALLSRTVLRASPTAPTAFRSVESIPTTADMDGDGIPGGRVQGIRRRAPSTTRCRIASLHNNGNLLVIVDGRADSALPTSSDPTVLSATHRTKRVIYGETRGHLALGDIDGDPDLEVVAAHNPGVRAYDPFKVGNPSGTTEASVSVWSTEAGDANNKYTGGCTELERHE